MKATLYALTLFLALAFSMPAFSQTNTFKIEEKVVSFHSDRGMDVMVRQEHIAAISTEFTKGDVVVYFTLTSNHGGYQWSYSTADKVGVQMLLQSIVLRYPRTEEGIALWKKESEALFAMLRK
jgi:hypothetical protein